MTKETLGLGIPKPSIDAKGNIRGLGIKLPDQKDKDKRFVFSFELFDRNHPLFNVGKNEHCPEAVSGEWFIELLDCLKEISNKNIYELGKGSMYDLHPVNWKKANAKLPEGHEQLEYYQFRINKSNGRVIGAKIDNLFYIVWLDRYHNLTDSDGYGKAKYMYRPKSIFEEQQEKIEILEKRINRYKQEIDTYESTFQHYCDGCDSKSTEK
jgi:hypothetical protein